MSSTDFSSLNLSPVLLSTLQEMGFEKMTPIQAQSIPLLLANKDLIGQSKTGSGKTVAFAVPILQKIQLESKEVQALILCPTRELCTQVAKEIRKLARRYPGLQVLILSGGQEIRPQILALHHGAHIVVGTPGRVLDHIQRGRLDLGSVDTLVLDEADRMLDMGFEEDMQIIMEEVPGTRQTVFFSATFPPSIKALSKKFQHEPKTVTIEEAPEDRPQIKELVCEITPDNKIHSLLRLLEEEQPVSAIIFCNLKVTVADLSERLKKEGASCAALHGDLEQDERNSVLAQFRNGSLRFLVATDVAARGLDIADLPLVINFDLPFEGDTYVHRIGRTGRAGKTGVAVSLATFQEKTVIKNIEEHTGRTMESRPIDYSRRKDFFNFQPAEWSTLFITGGRKDKMRPGDILGALTGEGELTFSEVGKIEIHDRYSYVAVAKTKGPAVLQRLRDGKIKGKRFIIKLVK